MLGYGKMVMCQLYDIENMAVVGIKKQSNKILNFYTKSELRNKY